MLIEQLSLKPLAAGSVIHTGTVKHLPGWSSRVICELTDPLLLKYLEGFVSVGMELIMDRCLQRQGL